MPRLKPQSVVITFPGDYRVLQQISKACKKASVPLEIRPDRHFFCQPDQFREFARGKSKVILETFYQHMRKKHKILLDRQGKPEGGSWNFDKENRHPFRKAPELSYAPYECPPDELSREVIDFVERRFRDHPGSLEHFQLPVHAADARTMLEHFIDYALPHFGKFQDAMWSNQAFLYHSRLSGLLNTHLLDPHECVNAAVEAYERGAAPLNSVEGFVRQILGWREFVRGMYWLHMPGYIDKNFFGAELALPRFYWDGETDMACMSQTMRFVLDHGYAHHIHRLMVAGQFALLFGVNPRSFHEWHMAMYLDAIDWVSLPNALGMSQYGDGGIVGTKPYCATGNYINRMSNFCGECRFDPKKAVGDDACPFTTLYWDFLDRNYAKLKNNARLKFQIVQLERKRESRELVPQIRKQARNLREQLASNR